MGRNFETAIDRWAGVGPYYAMFPTSFADEVIKAHTDRGDLVLDPFAGRGTAVFSAVSQMRRAIGIEINPVGYVYASTKLGPAEQQSVETRLLEIGHIADRYANDARALPQFFHRCFSRQARRFLLAARDSLNWRHNRTDRTLMALLMIYLHGKAGSAFSNQMRQTKAMSPQYAIRWWEERNLNPPEIDPVDFLNRRLKWRYARGTPNVQQGVVYLGDSRKKLVDIATKMRQGSQGRAQLLLTSPPYFAVTNYHYDQWLRLWLLGGPPNALRVGNSRGGKFESAESYKNLLLTVFTRAASVIKKSATVYVRTDSREFTYRTTIDVLRTVFPKKKMAVVRRPFGKPTQTRLFGNAELVAGADGEVDIILV